MIERPAYRRIAPSLPVSAGLDQRIKLVFPLPGVGISDFGADYVALLSEAAKTADAND